MENVFASRLVSARKMAGLSLQLLADRLENAVTKQALNKYEQGKMKPDSKGLIALANALNVPVDYFYSVPSVKVEFEGVDFRKYTSKLSKLDDDAVMEMARDKFERYFELEEVLNFEEQNDYFVFDKIVETADDAEEAAKKLRQDWALGYDPIPDVVEMLEDKGYKVIDIDAPDGFDGMKAYVGKRKLIVLNKTKNPESDDIVRKRFTALHELAHHALTFPDGIIHKEEEKLCHIFASAVLYPEDMARKELHKDRFHFYEKELVIIKERWGISFAAIFQRANRLGILNDYVLKKFQIGFKKRNYHLPNAEPGRYRSRENPTRMERLVYLGLAKEAITINEAAFFAGTTAWKLREQMIQLV
jgi:Zn-dependent peptidase ImmA (M78 family)/transcriptional regulator with XRE-family HTH domain